ncbi:hypothetical protein PV646_34095 [Streptomyces sp. ID05-26A]|nr:hypothetical protein [Streptomyces sp. ID05-26A]
MTASGIGVAPAMGANGPDVREEARQVIRDRAAAGLPELSGKRLGTMFERGERWGRDRIAEVRRSDGAAQPVAVPAQLDEEAAPEAAGSEPEETPTPAVEPTAERTEDAPSAPGRQPRAWPVLLLALPAFVAIWGGWVGLGELTGFGPVNLLPGIGDGWTINTAITLPIGVEAYAAYALRVWLSGIAPTLLARRFAMWSAIGSLVLGMAGQVAYHLMTAAGVTEAPWPITAFVSSLPVVVLGCGAALAHLLGADQERSRHKA